MNVLKIVRWACCYGRGALIGGIQGLVDIGKTE